MQSYRLVTVAVLVDRMKVNGSLARQCIADLEEKGMIKPIVTHSKMKIYSMTASAPIKQTTKSPETDRLQPVPLAVPKLPERWKLSLEIWRLTGLHDEMAIGLEDVSRQTMPGWDAFHARCSIKRDRNCYSAFGNGMKDLQKQLPLDGPSASHSSPACNAGDSECASICN